jgi:hypothetical protein
VSPITSKARRAPAQKSPGFGELLGAWWTRTSCARHLELVTTAPVKGTAASSGRAEELGGPVPARRDALRDPLRIRIALRLRGRCQQASDNPSTSFNSTGEQHVLVLADPLAQPDGAVGEQRQIVFGRSPRAVVDQLGALGDRRRKGRRWSTKAALGVAETISTLLGGGCTS